MTSKHRKISKLTRIVSAAPRVHPLPPAALKQRPLPFDLRLVAFLVQAADAVRTQKADLEALVVADEILERHPVICVKTETFTKVPYCL